MGGLKPVGVGTNTSKTLTLLFMEWVGGNSKWDFKAAVCQFTPVLVGLLMSIIKGMWL